MERVVTKGHWEATGLSAFPTRSSSSPKVALTGWGHPFPLDRGGNGGSGSGSHSAGVW